MSIIRKDRTHTLASPPEILHTKGMLHTFGKDIEIERGEAFSRQSTGVLKHYAIAYGFDKNITLWFLELNIDGVRFVTLRDFLAGHNGTEKVTKFPRVEWGILYERAKERIGHPYSAMNNNCEAFVEYLFTKKLVSKQAENIRLIAEITFRGLANELVKSQSPRNQQNSGKVIDNVLVRFGFNLLNPNLTARPSPLKFDFKRIAENIYKTKG